MRKLAYIILGLVMIIGSAGFFAQRYGYISIRQLSGISPLDQERSVTRSLRRARPTKPKPIKFAVFDRILDMLNLVVGMAGIWFSVVGLRMQRAATRIMALHEDEQGDQSRRGDG